MPKVLITGIRGFTGQYVSEALAADGYEVFGTVYRSQPLKDNEYSLDLLDLSALKSIIKELKPDVVVHLAGIAFVVHDDVTQIYHTHILGTRNLLQALAESEHGVTKVLLASTAQVYGHGTLAKGDSLNEGTAVSPNNDYSISKLAMEHLANLWRDVLPITIVRPFNYTGVGQASRFIIPKIVSAFSERKEQIELGNLNVFRDFSDVRFVAQCYKSLIESKVNGEIYNICSGSTVSLLKIIDIMEEVSGHKIRIKINPKFVRENDPKSIVGSNSKLLGLSSNLKCIDIKETLQWMYQSDKTKSRC